MLGDGGAAWKVALLVAAAGAPALRKLVSGPRHHTQ
jgi:hypothetical protein